MFIYVGNGISTTCRATMLEQARSHYSTRAQQKQYVDDYCRALEQAAALLGKSDQSRSKSKVLPEDKQNEAEILRYEIALIL